MLDRKGSRDAKPCSHVMQVAKTWWLPTRGQEVTQFFAAGSDRHKLYFPYERSIVAGF